MSRGNHCNLQLKGLFTLFYHWPLETQKAKGGTQWTSSLEGQYEWSSFLRICHWSFIIWNLPISVIYQMIYLQIGNSFYSSRKNCLYQNFISSVEYKILSRSKWHCMMSVFRVFWSVFSPIRTEYGDLLCKYSYSVQMRENNNQKNSEYGHFLRSLRTGKVDEK